MKKVSSIEDLFLVLLSDIYSVEVQLVHVLPILARKAESKELKDAILTHLNETKEQVVRIERIFNKLNEEPVAVEPLSTMHYGFEQAQKFLSENTSSPAIDAAIIAIAQRVEHFEISTYGTLKEFADLLEYDEIKDLLKETLKEEAKANETLNKIATGGLFSSGINTKALPHR